MNLAEHAELTKAIDLVNSNGDGKWVMLPKAHPHHGMTEYEIGIAILEKMRDSYKPRKPRKKRRKKCRK